MYKNLRQQEWVVEDVDQNGGRGTKPAYKFW